MTQIRSGHQARWRITGGRYLTPAPFLVAGIVNITPDSFSDGGTWFAPEAALERVRQVVAEGADMVDLGAESTRPGARDIGQDEEWRRLRPVLEGALALRGSLTCARPSSEPDTVARTPERACLPFTVSIDTFRSETAALVLSPGPGGGADVINDVSGGSFDPAMLDVLAQFKPGYVLGHSPARPDVMQRDPHYDDVVSDLLHWFSARMTLLVKAGLPEECICLDPCVGFGKNLEHNLAVCAAVPRFAALGRPLYFGVSRKRFLSSLLGEPTAAHGGRLSPPACSSPGMRERDVATQAAITLLANAGVAVHRVHQVADTVATLKIVRGLGLWGKGKGRI